jgi:hypothetical protein
MGILLTIAGIVIVVYTISSVVGLWLSYQMMDAIAEGGEIPEALEEAPEHHLDMIANYARGWRRHAWALSIIGLFTTLIALAIGSPLAFWALGIVLVIDSLLFVTYEDLRAFLAQISIEEQVLDALQCLALLACFALLLWINLRAGDVITGVLPS